MKHFEVSAKSGKGIGEIFDCLANRKIWINNRIDWLRKIKPK